MRSRMFAIPAPSCVWAGSNPAPESQTVKSNAPRVSERSTETGTGPACLAALSSAARHAKYTAISTSGLQRRTPLACTVTAPPDCTPTATSAAANPKELSSAGYMPCARLTHLVNHAVDVVTERLQPRPGLGLAALAEAVGGDAELDSQRRQTLLHAVVKVL